MGMGNDGIELSNSLESYKDQLNNSRLRDVNSEKNGGGGGDIPTENNTENIMGWGDIDSTLSGALENCPNARNDDSRDMNNATLESSKEEEDHSDLVVSKTPATDTTEESKHEEKDNENGSSSDDTDAQNPPKSDTDSDIAPKNSLPVEAQDGGVSVKLSVERPPGMDCQTGPTPAPVLYYRNESLLRVSHLKRNWGGRRVSDIRSVSELMETFYSLEEPIIIPLPRQRDYYNQWARIPRCDVVQRLYPRANNNMTSKYWNLFQAIQNDQGKSNTAHHQSPALSPQKLAPPSTNEVACKSLDSIIDHYHQMLQHQQAEDISTTTAAATASPPLAQRMTTTKNRSNSGSSRSSSSSSNRGNITSSSAQKQNASQNVVTRLKISPVPSRKVKISESQICDSNPSLIKHTDASSLSTSNHRVKKNSFPDYELTPDPILSSVEVFDISSAQRICQTPRSPISSRRMSDLLDHPYDRNGAKSPSRTNGHPSGLLVPMSATREIRDSASSPQPDSNDQERTSAEQGGKDATRNLYGINTNTLSLSLPYERAQAQTAAEIQPPSANGNNVHSKSKPTAPYDDSIGRKTKAPEKHERFPLRSTNFISRSKRATTALDIHGYSKARLKNLTRTIPPTSHSIQNLKESLLIHEINCDSDSNNNNTSINNDQRKWEQASKRRGSSSNKAQQSLQHECRPMLPVRVHSMLEHHLNPTTPSADNNLSPEVLRTPSRGNSAVSLASVHFLDLADLKNLLKKSNTTITHL